MAKFLRSFIAVERTIQLVALVGVVVFLGLVLRTTNQYDRTPSTPATSPTTQR
jgi:hypothetical protein